MMTKKLMSPRFSTTSKEWNLRLLEVSRIYNLMFTFLGIVFLHEFLTWILHKFGHYPWPNQPDKTIKKKMQLLHFQDSGVIKNQGSILIREAQLDTYPRACYRISESQSGCKRCSWYRLGENKVHETASEKSALFSLFYHWLYNVSLCSVIYMMKTLS